MAGRGRGRGRGLSFNTELLGFGRGEALPGPILQPPPTFPTLKHKALPFPINEENNYLLALKQEFRGNMRESAYFIKPPALKKDIERYSDKYQSASQNELFHSLKIDWNRLPKELKPVMGRKRKKASQSGLQKKVKTSVTDIEIKLKELESKETEEDDNEQKETEKEENKEGEEEEEEEEFYDEEEQEEGTDYNFSYFDNGENYLDEEEDNLDDGPIY